MYVLNILDRNDHGFRDHSCFHLLAHFSFDTCITFTNIQVSPESRAGMARAVVLRVVRAVPPVRPSSRFVLCRSARLTKIVA